MFLYCILFALLRATLSYNPVTPPYCNPGHPEVANGRIYCLDYIPSHCTPPIIDRFPGGRVIKDNRALVRADNPHEIKGNIEISPKGCLYIEPGTVLKFGAGFGIIVNGTLIARGSARTGGRIIMTKLSDKNLGQISGDWQDNARLSMGNTTKDGRLDLQYQGVWSAVCSNYNNFTLIDANVTCRHLGFLKGNFTYHSYARNLTDYILWEKPGCRGNENSLFDCPGTNTIKTGRHICDGQQVVGFSCEGLRPGLALDHWRGIDFYNTTTNGRFQIQDSYAVYMQESDSFLEYLDISYTGLDTYHGQTDELGIFYQKAAISASPYVPRMNNVTIKYGAYDGLNLTEVISPIWIANSTISNNRGYGMFIQSSVGRTLINMTEVSYNWGDGIKFYISNLTIYDFRKKFPPEKSMCDLPNVSDQPFPFYQHLDLVQVNGDKRSKRPVGGYCERTFSTKRGMRIGVHFLILERDPAASGEFIFTDGHQTLDPVPIENGSFPQSITTRTNMLRIRLNYKQPANLICKDFPPCIRFLLEFTASDDVEEDFRMYMSSVHNNTGYGVNIQDIRSKIRISNRTVISDNQFGAGLRIYRGAGEIVVNGTRLERNADAGINITYAGGYQLINNTEMIGNKGYGMITEYIKLNSTRIEKENRIEIVRSVFAWNELIGLRMGNYCKGGDIKINESHFDFNYDEAFEYLSCNISTNQQTRLRLEFNKFEGNFRHAILMHPFLNTKGIMTNNTFLNHSLTVVRIDNDYDLLISKWYRNFPVSFKVFENTFTKNSGRYVLYFRLTQSSAKQQILCKFNYFENNEINNSFPFLNPRSKANAVAILSSSNVKFIRNIINNPESVREVSTHLVDPSVTIDASENFWGFEVIRQEDYQSIYTSIFDQNDRFNLAQIKYQPALRTKRFYDNYLTNVPLYEWKFDRPGNVIGGELLQSFTARTGNTYFVDRDIFIHPKMMLTVQPGAKLKFASSVGMVVHGILKADGQDIRPVVFDIDDSQEFVPMENRTTSIRLSDGVTEFEGRLEVQINGQWGTVCHDGWIEENSLLACQQLGLSYDRANPVIASRVRADSSTPILMSWVSCTDVDVDFTKCRSISSDIPTCTHDQDVYLRCQKATWAGITLAAAYRQDQQQPGQTESQIRHVQILQAGLLDPATASLTPALRIDYNFYQISFLTIRYSVSDAIHVYYSHPYTVNKMEYVTLTDNAENGLVTHSSQLWFNHSFIERNKKAGFMYDPFFTEYETLLIRHMIHPTRREYLLSASNTKVIPDGHMRFFLTTPGEATEKKDYLIQIWAETRYYRLVVQVMDYLPVESVEKLIIYDSSQPNMYDTKTRVWEIEKDLVDFPILSTSQTVTLKLTVNGLLSGRLALAIISVPLRSGPPQLLTAMTNTTLARNDQGIVTKHYNNPSNKRLELFFRHKKEEIYFKDLRVLNNKRHAMHMPSVTKFHEDYIPTYEDMTRPERVARIIYKIHLSVLRDNQMGILAEHNHVDFANNVWQWEIDHVTMDGCKRGGLEIEVPRVNDETEQEIHKVHVTVSTFKDNTDFALTVAGYYADVKIDLNTIINNKCLFGLITLSGMEKTVSFFGNLIQNNVGRHVLDMNILSHWEYSTNVIAKIEKNRITDNRYEGSQLPGSDFTPKTYTIALKGLQTVKANINIFHNADLEYELVAGVTALSLNNEIDVQRNFWGSEDESVVRERIFDFDDWNNYAIADYFPYLEKPDFDAVPTKGERNEVIPDPIYLQGRLEKSQLLLETGRPIIVLKDVTIMPNVVVKVPPGTEIQFKPDVGILVLGRLIADGTAFSRIKMRPLQPKYAAFLPSNKRRKRSSGNPNLRLRGDGTLFKNSGFLELYNTSSRSWNIICDNLFNEKTAEVVCRELGLETINVKVRFTHLYDHYIFGKPMYFRKEFWFNSYHCRGDETELDQCIKRHNYNLQSCVNAGNYTFITCGDRNLEFPQQYWGNIRFANISVEEQALEAEKGIPQSSMSFVDIEGAGILHGQKVGAIQTTYVTPKFKNINITKCAGNGYDIIAPRSNLEINMQNISNNLGYGVNILMLNGESRNDKSSFLPNGPSTIPYNVYGLVDICSMEKEISISTRVIVFYKYGPNNRDCVKIIKAKSHFSQVGVRFLQINLFQEDFSRNVIEIFDGKEIKQSNRLASIVANSTQEDVLRRYDSQGDTVSIHMHASVGHEVYGFIAEVVKLPFSGLTFPNSEFSHEIQHAEIRGNQDGAIKYKNVGEVNPSLFIEHCFIYNNGYPILNLTSPPTIDISLQSTLSLRLSHNQITHNKGGMYLFAYTRSINTALNGNITNNVFAFGSHGEAINISGHYFPRLMLHQNYIYNYTAGDFRDIIHVKDVVVNFTQNYILHNLGHYIIHIHSNDDSSMAQTYARNGIYNNNSTAIIQSTIKIGQGKPQFSNNYLVNSLNDFEMETYPKIYQNTKPIPAKGNWWGSERRVFIAGKLYDHFDDEKLVEVDFWPPIIDNRSLIEGQCSPGWVLEKGRCYRYMGGALPYNKAKDFCESHGAFLAEVRGREAFFKFLIKLQVVNLDWAQRIWVMSDVGRHQCSAFEQNYVVVEEDCHRRYYPFICETDPSLALPSELADSIKAMIIGISTGVGGIIFIIIIVILILWCLKSKRREKERFERTASIRSSINNLNKIGGSLRGTKSTLTILSEAHSRRRLNEFDDRSMVSTAKNSQSSAVTNDFEGSTYSINSGYGVRGNPTPAPVIVRQENGRPVHSLRPDRGGRRMGNEREREEREREEKDKRREVERRRIRQEEEEVEERRRQRVRHRYRDENEGEVSGGSRGKYDDSDDDSVKKEDISDDDDDSDSFDEEFDEDENDRGDDNDTIGNAHYRVHRSFEHLLEKRAEPEKPRTGFGRRNGSRDNISDLNCHAQADALPPKPKLFSSFAQPDPSEPPVQDIHSVFPQAQFRENLPTPPPDPRRFGSASNIVDNYNQNPKPNLKPKPIPTYRDGRSPAPSDRSQASHRPAPAPRQGTQELYNNAPTYDHVYDDRSSNDSRNRFHKYRNVPDESDGGPLYDPVFDGRSDISRSTDKYEAIEYDPPSVRNEQLPEMDYMSRQLGNLASDNPVLGRSRERLGPPPPAPLPRPVERQYKLESDIDSYAPSLQSDVDYMPRQFQHTRNNIPPKPGAPDHPSSYRGSNDDLNANAMVLQPPPYTEDPRMLPRTISQDILHQYNVTQDRLDDQPPPYYPEEELMPRRHGGSRDVLYLGTGARPKRSHESLETEI